MPIFTRSLRKIDASDSQTAIKEMANHIRYIQEQLEYTLLNLDSQNIREIDTDDTTITDSTGSTTIGSSIRLLGDNGESFRVGKDSAGIFEFWIRGEKGKQLIYLDNSGNLVITKNVTLTIDGGEW